MLPGLDDLVVRRTDVEVAVWLCMLSFFISANLMSLKILLSRSVVPIFHSDSVIDTTPEYSSPNLVKKRAGNIMAAPLAGSLQSPGVML